MNVIVQRNLVIQMPRVKIPRAHSIVLVILVTVATGAIVKVSI